MIDRLIRSRTFLSVATVVALLGSVGGGYKVLMPSPEMRSYCALMPDSIGLFEGSAVSILGIDVGSVTSIEPEGGSSRVDFEIPANRALPLNVGATTVADSLIADRRLAVIGNEPSGPAWDSSRCIDNTLTPQSLTETFTALSNLADELNGQEDGGDNLLAGGIAALNDSTKGTSDQINRIVHGLGAALDSPDAAIANIGNLIYTLASLARSARSGWGDVHLMVTRLTEEFDAATKLAIPPIVEIMDTLHDLLPAANDLVKMFGTPALRSLSAHQDLPRLISAGVSDLRDVVTMLPAVSRAFTDSLDPETGRVSLTYAAPRVEIPDPHLAQVCAALDGRAGQSCAVDSGGLVDIPLEQLILEMTGAR
ncbi:MlaD family protein [Rhodococcus sp. EPR-157]|uniref:MlaD family protein n=1 Tax=Rhodococcus sp. EPR-157 TaxID=1813677 RepID=UPI00083894EF|nr:MlaD family protein [Rhodococcus sp. EPR-157]